MEDYELGRLAEELIQSRYSEKLKAKDEQIKTLENAVEKRLYAVGHVSSWGGIGSYDYYSFDDLTENLKKTKESLRIAENDLRKEQESFTLKVTSEIKNNRNTGKIFLALSLGLFTGYIISQFVANT